jgi:hypothetical protein
MRIILFFLIILNLPLIAQEDCFGPRYKHQVFRTEKIIPNINFGKSRKNEFGRSFILVADLYEPKDDTLNLRPVIFLIHGGAHVEVPLLNRKSPDIVALAKDLAKRGYVVISPEYRLIQDFINPTPYKTFIKALYHSIFDIQDAFCYFVESYHNGNPYKIDINRVFIGGVSSGALITTQSLLLNDISELDPLSKQYLEEVEIYNKRSYQEILDNKFCGANILGALCLSTILFDTSIIKQTSNSWLFSHDKSDKVTPFKEGKLLNSELMPIVYGPGNFAQKLSNTGTKVDSSYFDNGLHPVFLEFSIDNLANTLSNISLETFLNPRGLEDLIFDLDVLDSTANHIASFCFELLGCEDPITTGLFDRNIIKLEIFPNPSSGNIYMQLANNLIGEKVEMKIINYLGQVVKDEILTIQNNLLSLNDIPTGQYLIIITTTQKENTQGYLGKIVVK